MTSLNLIFLNGLLDLVKPFMTGVNAGATNVDIVRNESLTKQIHDRFNMELSEEEITQCKLYAFHALKTAEYISKLNSLESRIDSLHREQKEAKLQSLKRLLKSEARNAIKEYEVDHDIINGVASTPDPLCVLVDFIANESNNAITILERIYNITLLPKCVVKNANILMALPELVGDRGTKFCELIEPNAEEFLEVVFTFKDEEQKTKPSVTFASFSITLEITRTTRKIVITDDFREQHFNLML